MNNKKLAEIQDYNPSDLTSCGGDWTLYGDGRIGMTTRSRWQGSRDGARYVTDPGHVDVAALGANGEDDDAEAALTQFADTAEIGWDDTISGMRKIRMGTIVG